MQRASFWPAAVTRALGAPLVVWAFSSVAWSPQAALAQTQSADESTGQGDAAPAIEDAETSAEARVTDSLEDRAGRRRLSDHIKAVQRKVFLKRNRVELFPQFALDLNDPFFQHLIVGGALAYHVVDSLSIEGRGGFVFASIKQGALRFVRQETDSLIKNPPEFKYHFDLDAVWAPIYGKISLFGDAILHFDTYVTAGPGVFGTDGGLHPAVNVGLGQRYFINRWLTARFELRNYLFLDQRNGTSDLQNLLVFGFALSGFLPTSFDYEYQ